MIRLNELRKKQNLTMREASLLLGLPYTTYVGYEKGYREPSCDMLVHFASTFGVSVDYLIGMQDALPDDPPSDTIPDQEPTDYGVTFADRLKSLRIERKLTQSRLADLIHKSKSSIAMYESNKREPGIQDLVALSDIFDVDLNFLCGKTSVCEKSLSCATMEFLQDFDRLDDICKAEIRGEVRGMLKKR